jgi:uncharacterized membrane protein YcaP (DUF421 family)
VTDAPSMPPIDWQQVFIPSVHPGEIFIRGTVVYLFIFAAMRIFRRQAGAISISDLLVVVLIADAAQNAMAGEYKSITDGLILVATVLFWNFSVDWLAFRFPKMQRLLHPPSLPLIKNGKIQYRNLRGQMMTRDELMELLREHGVESPEEVKEARLEPDGHVSVIRKDSAEEDQPERKRRGLQ